MQFGWLGQIVFECGVDLLTLAAYGYGRVKAWGRLTRAAVPIAGHLSRPNLGIERGGFGQGFHAKLGLQNASAAFVLGQGRGPFAGLGQQRHLLAVHWLGPRLHPQQAAVGSQSRRIFACPAIVGDQPVECCHQQQMQLLPLL